MPPARPARIPLAPPGPGEYPERRRIYAKRKGFSLTQPPPRIDRQRLRPVAVRSRPSKVRLRDEGRPHRTGASLAAFLDGLPRILAAADLRRAIDAGARAHAR